MIYESERLTRKKRIAIIKKSTIPNKITNIIYFSFYSYLNVVLVTYLNVK